MARGWARRIKCQFCGEWHFGAGGAAGILLVRRDNTLPGRPATHVVLQHRADTRNWAIPGGFRDNGETYRQTALREAEEEISLPRNCTEGANPLVVIRREETTLNHINWQYRTFIADVMGPFIPRRPPGDSESLSVEWAPIDQVGVRGGRFYPLLPQFWQVWDQLRDMVREMGGPTIQPILRLGQPTQPVQPPQQLQGINPVLPDESVPPLPVTHGLAVAPSNTGPPIDPGVRIVESDDEQEESVKPQGAERDKKGVQIVESDDEQEESIEPQGAERDKKGVQIVESDDEQEESIEPQGTGRDKKGVPSDHPVPPRGTPAAVKAADEELINFASFRGAGREFRGRKFGYMSWNARSDQACRPS